MANANYSPASTREDAIFCIGGMPTKGAQASYERFSDTELLGRLVGVRQAKSMSIRGRWLRCLHPGMTPHQLHGNWSSGGYAKK